jgi:hypothetical protein
MSHQEPRRYKEGQRQSRDSGAGVEYKDGRNQQVTLKLLVRATGSKCVQLRDPIPDLAPGTSRILLSERQLRQAKAAATGGRI